MLPAMAGVSRRLFLAELLGGAGVLGCAGPDVAPSLAAPHAERLRVALDDAPALREAGGSVVLAAASSTPVLLIRRAPASGAEFVALARSCSHQRCPLDYRADDDELVCRCHGSRFSIDGAVRLGPAQQPIARYPVFVNGDHVEVELRRARPPGVQPT